MNCLSEEKQLTVLRLLVEGNSLSGISRLTGVHRDTCMRLMVRFGQGCKRFLDVEIQDLQPRHIQVDEIYTFVRKWRGTKEEHEPYTDFGRFFIFVALDEDTKLVPSFLVGRRNRENTVAFLRDLAHRMLFPIPHASDDHGYEYGRITPVTRISSDGWMAYPEAVDLAFGGYAQYAQIIKKKANNVIHVEKRMIQGKFDPRFISTSLVERNNLTIRTFLKRLARKSLCFSKKVANLEAAAALHFAYYNYCWRHKTLGTSPAVAAGLAPKRFTLEELVREVRKVA